MRDKFKGLFATAFRAYLDGSGKSQAQVAEAAGMSRSNLHSYLASDPRKERREPAIATALRLALAAGARVVLEGGEVIIERSGAGQAGAFADPRDGRTYRTVELNGLEWLAQNLNYDVGEGCWFYDNDPTNGEKYGRLYTWESAQRACPPGWRLPTDEEWRALAGASGGLWDGQDQGDPKKAYSALIEGGSTGFAALLGGYRSADGPFNNLGGDGIYWSATEFGGSYAWRYYFNSSFGKLYRVDDNKGFGFSVRCVREA